MQETYLIINIIIIILIIKALVGGYKKGFLAQLVSFFSLMIIIIFSSLISGILARFIDLTIFMADLRVKLTLFGLNVLFNRILWFIILMFVGFIIMLCLNKFLTKILDNIPIVNFVNRFLGSLMALLKTFTLFWLIASILSFNLFTSSKPILNNTLLSTVKYAGNVTADYVIRESYRKRDSQQFKSDIIENKEEIKSFFIENKIKDRKSFESHFMFNLDFLERIFNFKIDELIKKVYEK